MKKNIQWVFSLIISILMVSCGGSDIITDEPDPSPLFNIQKITGKKEGILRTSLPAIKKERSDIAEVLVYILEGTTNNLQVAFSNPSLVQGGTVASDFVIDKENCAFVMNKYTPTHTIYEGDKIPEYIKEWFTDYDINKVVIGEMTCPGGATFDTSTANLAMLYTSTMTLYIENNEVPLSYSLQLQYVALKNK